MKLESLTDKFDVISIQAEVHRAKLVMFMNADVHRPIFFDNGASLTLLSHINRQRKTDGLDEVW